MINRFKKIDLKRQRIVPEDWDLQNYGPMEIVAFINPNIKISLDELIAGQKSRKEDCQIAKQKV